MSGESCLFVCLFVISSAQKYDVIAYTCLLETDYIQLISDSLRWPAFTSSVANTLFQII